ncbi:MAG: hypothetical protein GY870_07615, partial [archaeon]|nr:hypothetical protein [archaeon]
PNPSYNSDDLTAEYDYSDVNGAPEGDSEILWYNNGTMQSVYENETTVPSSATNIGDQWHFSVRPHNGTVFGSIATSLNTTILTNPVNSPPVASSPLITPDPSYDFDDLTANYDYYDSDGDVEGDSKILWYKNGVIQPTYENETTIPSSAINFGEEWHFSIRPHDGIIFGDIITSENITISTNNVPVFSPIPDDIICNNVTTGNNITWIIIDSSTRNPTYSLIQNGSEVITDEPWISGEPIVINIDNLNIGRYNFTIYFDDGLGEIISDEVFVTVNSFSNSDLMTVIVVGVFCVFGIAGYLAFGRKKN